MLSPQAMPVLNRLLTDFEFYAAHCLQILTKGDSDNERSSMGGAIVPFRLNAAQQYLDQAIREQLAESDMVRIVALKGRQQGISTYVEGRYYWKTSTNKGLRAYILTHRDDATRNLFGMAQRYHDLCPPQMRPECKRSNAKELEFEHLMSGYQVATAGGAGAGRSGTVQLFHGCLSPNTFIVDGVTGMLRRMDTMRLGDLIRTHTGAIAPISVISRQYKNALSVTIKGLGQIPLIATEQHRFLTGKGWRELGDLEIGDKLLFPIPKITEQRKSFSFRLPDKTRPQGGGTRETGPESVDATYDLGIVLGLYLAEGCIIKQTKTKEPSAISIAVHEQEVDRTEKWLDAVNELFRSRKTSPRAACKTVVVTAYGRSFATFVRTICGELDGKQLPNEWWTYGKDFVKGLIHGYLSGDGCSSHQEYDRRITAPSIRSAISIGMRDALASLDYGWSCIGYHPGRLRYGKTCRPIWHLRLSGQGVDVLCEELGWKMPPRRRNGNYGEVKIKDGFAHIPIIDIEDVGEIEVMDFEINHDDHSYCTVHAASHNSEVAFWPKAQEHMAGLGQAVPMANGTEIIMESTANGIGNVFHNLWQEAVRGEGLFQAVFIPWFWQPEYRMTTHEASRELSAEDREYQAAFDLDEQQMAWRAHKLRFEFLGDVSLFNQEYPATPELAFQRVEGETFIRSEIVAVCRRAKWEGRGPLLMGIDPAEMGKDATAIIFRRGRVLESVKTWHKHDTMEVTGIAAHLINEREPDAVFVDAVGIGAGVYARLKELFPQLMIYRVMSGETAMDDEKYANRRAEMWGRMREWMEEGAVVPDDDGLHADLTAPQWGFDSSGRILLEKKDRMRKRGMKSPDRADAVALTFAYPVQARKAEREMTWRERLMSQTRTNRPSVRAGSGL